MFGDISRWSSNEDIREQSDQLNDKQKTEDDTTSQMKNN